MSPRIELERSTDPREISATKIGVIQITEFLHFNITAKVSINCPWGNAYQSDLKFYRAHSFLFHGIEISFVGNLPLVDVNEDLK